MPDIHLESLVTVKFQVYAIFRILYLAFRQLKPLYPYMLFSKPEDSTDQNQNLTLQNTIVVGLPLTRSVNELKSLKPPKIVWWL